jgi:hypothetical protein
MELTAEICKGEVIHTALELPDWVSQYLGQKFTKENITKIRPIDLSSVDEVRKRYFANNKNRKPTDN